MNILKITQKHLLVIALLLFLSTSYSQEKLIGFNQRGSLESNGNAFIMGTNGTNYTKNVEFPFAPGMYVDMVDGNDGYFYGSSLGNDFANTSSVFKIRYNGTDYTLLKRFTRATEGSRIRWRPVVAPDGYLYGICENGGTNNYGTIWKLKKDGSDFSLLRTFNNTTNNENGNTGSLTLGLDGKLYGTITGGNGYIIRINTDGSGFTKLVTFTNVSGAYPGNALGSPLLRAGDGMFYGVCPGGGANSKGVAFKFNPITNAYTLLKAFSDNDGAYPNTTPTEGADGYIIGGCPNYGLNNAGSIWKIKKDGSSFSVLKQMDLAVTGNRPCRNLYIHTDGFMYGLMSGYGPTNAGTFFKMQQDGSSFTVLRSDFDGGSQAISLIYKEDSTKFYLVFGYGGSGSGGILATVSPDGNNYKRIYAFDYQAEGYAPINRPVVITNTSSSQYANAFGVTLSGGLNGNGNLFSYKPALPNQRHTVVHNFKDADGYSPAGRAEPILGSDDWLYGVLGYGGPIAGNTGTVYRVNPADTTTFTVIKSFGNYGTSPTNCIVPAYIMEAADGYLYGNTTQGGANNKGTIFRMKKDGTDYSNLYQFGGSNPLASGGGFIQDPATQRLIGIGTNASGDAVIFSMTTSATDFFTIKTFVAANAAVDGRNPTVPLLLINNVLYGACAAGPTNFGALFKVNKDNTGFALIKTFLNTEGGSPYGNLQAGDNDYLYGTCGGTLATSSGANIYKVKKDGSNFTILKSFGTDLNAADGNLPGQVVLLPCNAPNNASAITFSNVTTGSITLSGFAAPSTGGATGYVVKINTVNSFTPPANGSVPTANTLYGGGEQVIYAGTSISPINVTGLSPNTQYWFKVFAYGCTGMLYSNANTNNNPNMQQTVPMGVERQPNLMARLDGINDYASAGDVNALEGNTAISFGGWVKPQSFPATNFKVKSFVAKGDGVSTASTSFQAGLYKNDGSVLLVMAQVNINGAFAKVEIPVDSSMFRINQWSHFFVTWQTGNKLKLYINGRLAVQSLISFTGTVANTTSSLKLGSSDNGANEENFHGDMEEMQFYSTALSQCEIRQRKHITLTGTEPGLVAYYQFNEANAIPTFNDFRNSNNSSKQNGILALASDLSAGAGGSDCISVQSTDFVYNFNASDRSNRLEMSFPGLAPDGFMNGSYIEAAPVGGNPNPGANMLPGYWIIDNYGNNQSNLNALLTFKLADGILTDATLTNYRLYKRPSNGSGTWEMFPITNISMAPGNYTITVAGIPSFSQLVIISAQSPLPLQLLSFTGSLVNGDASLEWQTSNEINVEHFEVERKLPNENGFSTWSTVTAKNGSSNAYALPDKKLPAGTTWYRLKMVEKGGKVSYSHIITLSNKTNAITLFPNPAKDVINVVVPSNKKGMASIITVDGRVIQSNINIVSNINRINVAGLASGMYILKIETTEGTEMQRFIKQ